MPIENTTAADLVTAPRVTLNDSQRISLCEVLDRVLNKGVVVDGEATIAVAGIDLIYLGLKLVLTSIETARLGWHGAAADSGARTGEMTDAAL
ncbi:MAG: gas vesicle protein [Acidobacteriia bacterium]|nr:gas vesicle protein [Terriglobia bacterium]